jgi:hypothetical protein
VDGRVTIQLHLPDAWVDLEAAVEAIHRAESAVAQRDWVRARDPSWSPSSSPSATSSPARTPRGSTRSVTS